MLHPVVGRKWESNDVPNYWHIAKPGKSRKIFVRKKNFDTVHMMPACVRKMRWELSIWNVSGLQLKLTDSLDQESFPHSAGDVISQAQQGGQAVFRYESFLISMLRCLDSNSAVFSSLVVIALCGFSLFFKAFFTFYFQFYGVPQVSHCNNWITRVKSKLLTSNTDCSHQKQVAPKFYDVYVF